MEGPSIQRTLLVWGAWILTSPLDEWCYTLPLSYRGRSLCPIVAPRLKCVFQLRGVSQQMPPAGAA